jgi:hypothetical protein
LFKLMNEWFVHIIYYLLMHLSCIFLSTVLAFIKLLISHVWHRISNFFHLVVMTVYRVGKIKTSLKCELRGKSCYKTYLNKISTRNFPWESVCVHTISDNCKTCFSHGYAPNFLLTKVVLRNLKHVCCCCCF